jgi:putative methylase
MKKKELEILLQNVPSPNQPIPNLEQYMTPANIAADIIFIAYQFGDIENKIIVDLGCGTGIFSVGAILTGSKQVIGIDTDKNVILTAKEYANKNNLNIEYKVIDVKKFHKKCNTVIMNPPFGAQKSNQKADRMFIEKGFEISQVIYTIHLQKTIPFLEKMISSIGGRICYRKKYRFPIKRIFNFHEKKVMNYEVTMLRIKTNSLLK